MSKRKLKQFAKELATSLATMTSSVISDCSVGKLYLEVGGKFLLDGHASRVLTGFDPACKVKILRSVAPKFDIILCVNAKDICGGRVWEEGRTYPETLFSQLEDLKKAEMPRPKIAINLFNGEPEAKKLSEELRVCIL
jgi:uncharacterized protein (UPF0371 family)